MKEAEDALNEFVQELPKIKEVIAVFLYGSLVRGEYSKRHSDIDLLMVINKKKIPSRLMDKIEMIVSQLNAKHKVRIHPEYQGLTIKEEDKSLLRKMFEEGKVIYSSGMLVFGNKQLGLKAYYIYTFRAKKRLNQIKLSQALHGRKSWYYKSKKKVVKHYPGIIDDKDIIEFGRGSLIVSLERKKHIEMLFEELGVDYKIKKIVYGV